MYLNNKIIVGKSDTNEVSILLDKANRHGIITGASGSGKTITLKVLAESFSDAGVPVFLADVKGDLAGMCTPGENNENIQNRLNNMGIQYYDFKKYPTCFWDVYGKNGHPIRTTVNNIGYQLLSNMLGLTEAQEGVLAIAFKIANDKNIKLDDLKDLRILLQYVGDNRKDYTLEYGNITLQSVGAIQRSILVLQEQGGDYFFGKPSMEITDFIKYDAQDGRGKINILHAVELFQKPNLYASFLLWLLTELFNKLPEVGDLAKPKIIFCFDEAHLLFEQMPDYMIRHVTQIVKLIRSKGIGLYFISQCPTDVPNDILSQLGNRIQHTLRAYTPAEQKNVKAAAQAFRINPNINTEEAIMSLGTGEALVSFQNEFGEPSMVEKATILPPQSKMGTIDDYTRQTVIASSQFYGKYDTLIDDESAYEIISDIKYQQEQDELAEQERKEEEKREKEEKKAEEQRLKEEEKLAKAEEKQRKEEEKELLRQQKEEERKKKEEERALEKKKKEEEKARKNSVGYKLGKKVTNKAVDKAINKGLNSVFKNLFK